MALQTNDYLLVNRSGVSYRYAWEDVLDDVELSMQIDDVFSFTGPKGATTKSESLVPLDIDNGIRLPIAGTGDYNQDGAIRYSPTNSKIELYYAGAWNTASGGTAFSPTPPVPATIGDVWYDTDNGRAYVYYYDGTSSQWVEMNPAWDGGVPPSVLDGALIVDGSITPSKLSPDAIKWDTSGYHSIGQSVDQTVRLAIRSLNSNNEQKGLELTQADATNVSQQTFSVSQNDVTSTSTITVDNSASNAQLVIALGSSPKLTIPESGNITSNVPIQSNTGFVGNVTGDLTGTASQINRNGVSSSTNNDYRLLLGDATNASGSSSAYVVTNATRAYYNPSQDRLTVGTFAGNLTGTANNSNQLGGLAASSFFNLGANNTASGANTFSGQVTYSNSTRHLDNVTAQFGNSNDARFYFNGSNLYTDLSAGNWFIRDGNSTRFTFNRTAGTFTSTGNITAPNFVGNLSGNATSANSATTAQTTNQVNVIGVGSSVVPVLLGDDVNPGNNQDIQRDQTLFWDGTSNTLNTFNLQLTGTVQGGTYTNLRCEGTIREEVYTIPYSTNFTIDPENGSFQLVTLASSTTTPTEAGWVAGESVTLMISNDNSSRTVNWGTLNVRWANGVSPDITASGGYTVLQLWKIGSSIYGAIVGDVI